ncbi:MAG TPA: ATP-dependent Clp protease adaptor ClpS [bacterium]|nr:ATP-dependent Clp protease adaptor ClpS [bacterium]
MGRNFPGVGPLLAGFFSTSGPLRAEGSGSVRTTTFESVELGNPWQTVLFNDEVHSFDEVILQIQKATGFPLERAAQITLRVHHNGKAIVTIGAKAECERVAAILGQIQLTTSVEKT